MSVTIANDMICALLDAREQNKMVDARAYSLSCTLNDAYELQRQVVAGFAQENIQSICGWKVALSGAIAQKKYGIQEPVFGQLTTDQKIYSPAHYILDANTSPKLEIELAFELQTDLNDQALSDEQLLAAVGNIIPALEIAHTRWLNWDMNIQQFISDNSAAHIFILGTSSEITVNAILLDKVINEASVAIEQAITKQDNPITNYLWLVRKLLAMGRPIKQGQIILTGSLIKPINLQPQNYNFQVLGQNFKFQVSEIS